MFKPIQQSKGFLQIAKQIRNLIDEGKLKPGDRLPPERHLAESFGTSRTTVREALRALEIVGVIESKVGQGTFIKALSLAEIDNVFSEIESQTSPMEVFEARIAIEPYLAKLACANATNQDIKSMEECIKILDESVNDYQKFEKWDGEFHQSIAKASKNLLLIKFTRILNDVRLEKLWGSLKKRSLTAERIKRYQQDHRNILQAIKERDSTLAEKYTYQHIINVKRNIFEEDDDIN